jgi:phosphoribosylglycinamide formyltransferase-1
VSTLGILASGRGSNCEAILRAARSGALAGRVGIVLSDRPDAPVLAKAEAMGVSARFLDPGRKGARLSPEAEAAYVEVLRGAGAEWVALAGFMRIIGKPLLEAYAGRILNIHPSLLPAFPGLNAQAQALDYGVKMAGCTVHFVNEGVDTGPILVQNAVPVREGDTAASLSARILAEEHVAYVKALNLVFSGRYRLEGRRVVLDGEGEA